MCIKLTRMQLYNQLLKSTNSTLVYYQFQNHPRQYSHDCVYLFLQAKTNKNCACVNKKKGQKFSFLFSKQEGGLKLFSKI